MTGRGLYGSVHEEQVYDGLSITKGRFIKHSVNHLEDVD